MKHKLIIAATLLLSAGFAASAETVPATDSRITYIGRTARTEDSVSYNWSATTFKVKFTGSNLTVKISATKSDWFNVWVDKAQCAREDARFNVASKDTVITLFAGKKGTHEVIVERRTEGQEGITTVSSFTTNGKFVQATPLKDRVIEFVGDSYTCGYGTEGLSRTDPWKPETENPALTYADILGRFFDADAIHISHSGRGVARNYGDNTPEETMPKLYTQVYDAMGEQPQWTPDYQPDIVVVYLGTNDFSTGKQPSISYWKQEYIKLLKEIRTFHPDAPIFCLASMAGEEMDRYVEEAVKAAGFANVYWTAIESGAHNSEDDLGSSWHPNYKGHRKVASCIGSYIATITGWEMPFKAYE